MVARVLFLVVREWLESFTIILWNWLLGWVKWAQPHSVPPGFSNSAIAEFIAKLSKLRNFRKGSQIFIISADFLQILGLDASRDVITTRIVKERLFLSLKNGMNSLRSHHARFTRATLDEQIRATRLGYRPFICSGQSRGLLSITRHRYTQRWEIQWRK